MADPLKIRPEWYATPVIVAASGPSLTAKVIYSVRKARWFDGWRVLAVNDAAMMMPFADAVYAADATWWRVHKGVSEMFEHCQRYTTEFNCDEKGDFPRDFPNVRIIGARQVGDFSRDPAFISYGDPEHSGFQAVNLALLLGASAVVLVGFDYRYVDGKAHFFGNHPPSLRQFGDEALRDFVKAFDGVTFNVPIVNATPDSRLKKFPLVDLDEALSRHSGLHRDRAEPNAGTG